MPSNPPTATTTTVVDNSSNDDQHSAIYPVLDFNKTPLPEYNGHYCKIIDDLFSPSECADLLALAESHTPWSQAAVHYGLGPTQNYVNLEYRNSERILLFDFDAASRIYNKLLPHITEVIELSSGIPYSKEIVGGSQLKGFKYKLIGLNERLSYLKYGPGNYFRSHCDGRLELPDLRRSFITIQIYLGDDIDLQGGATRFSSNRSNNSESYIDVDPKLGRVLIFQQRSLTHSGEEVTKGIKYTLRSDLMFTRELVS
ncbi:hypothetical protein AGABI1DRAFT_65211 [Agaricus bisporus var. burnettii JB137-S8]|uniref:Prolyl 4-hydroxylase alpha subunit domain-containing protein n=1 Tax=Agaricus bisporus var. burnettii (strain JB137-S8 / ATCC MYA-4627 / FGSC 10392) TaxID=597362 RepID=K5WVQ9_AGABU|nr:uncharacterized protein AGABI1DRAFT_65211 [Agaricus bisporus var. burnettii JB137-S8]EKM74873.1 hypothetical protein AGABI1DRAFT_65211 [Agaricus bisporus var. burnettii JB137-S8]